jgi:hypothetical protein
MSGMIYVIAPCLCNEVSGMSEEICAIPCLCNEAWGMSRVFFVFVPCLYNDVWGMLCLSNEVWGVSAEFCAIFWWFMLLSRVYIMKFAVCQK